MPVHKFCHIKHHLIVPKTPSEGTARWRHWIERQSRS
jgi:hypothetical protein